MTNHNIVYETHPLYSQFVEWMGNENESINYFMVNTSLYATEEILKSQYGLNVRLHNVTEPISRNYLHTQEFITSLNFITSSGLLLKPKVNYFDNSTGTYNISDGIYVIKDNDIDLISFSSNTIISYNSGFLFKGNTFNTLLTGDGTKVTNTDGTSLPYPLFIDPSEVSYTVKVYGNPNDKIIMNTVDTGVVIGANGEASLTIPTLSDINSTDLLLESTSGKKTKITNITIAKLTTTSSGTMVIIGSEMVTNTSSCKVKVITDTDGTIDINSTNYVVTKGITTLIYNSLNIGTNFLKVKFTPNVGESTSSLICVDYNTSYSNDYIEEVNKDRLKEHYLPIDLLHAIFKVTQTLYKGILYRNEDTNRYSSSYGQSVTYGSHSVPKDVKAILHRYVAY